MPDRRSFLAVSIGTAAGMALPPALATSAKSDLQELTLTKAADLLRRRSVSAVELTQACLNAIRALDGKLNSFITVTSEQALASARDRDEELRRGTLRGPLHGIPIALKDNIDTAGVRTTAASELYKDRIPVEDAEVVRRLKDGGAILIGKANLHEFAHGSTSSVSYFGPVHNPWALDRIPGGSSGGPGAATAAGLCFGSLGTDTAGSVRMPASYCGIVGLKPTYGRVSNRGVVPLSWTLDHVGPMCRTVQDAALMLEVIAGFDPLEPSSADVPVPRYSRELEMRTARLRLGLPRTPFFDDLDAETTTAVGSAIELLRKLTASLEEVTLPATGALVRQILPPEMQAFHASSLVTSPEKYQPHTRERIVRFAQAVSKEEYVNARRQCELLRRQISKAFETIDVLAMPTMARPPALIEPADAGSPRDPERTRNAGPFNVYGLPAITVPCGFTRSGLPIGLQIVGAPFAESTVLALAHAYEQATDWHLKRPPLTAQAHPVSQKRSPRREYRATAGT